MFSLFLTQPTLQVHPVVLLVTFHFLPSVYEITLLQTERTLAVFVAGNGLDLFPLGKGVVVVRMAYGPLVHETPR